MPHQQSGAFSQFISRLKTRFSAVDKSTPPPTHHDPIVVLSVTPSQADQNELNTIASRFGWELIGAPDFAEAISVLSSRDISVILCDRDLPGRDWRESVKLLHAVVTPPCVILTSPVNDTYLWQEVVQNGGYDVLTRPFHAEQVASAIRQAWAFRKAGIRRS